VKLLLARHGNTFASGETAYVVGRGEDLPLTAEGEAQGSRLAEYLRREGLIPDAIFCGALKRTRRMAEIVSERLEISSPLDDPRLTELDFGDWAGLTMDDIRARFGAEEVDSWDRDAIMPEGRGWQPEAAAIAQNWRDFAADAGRRVGDGIALAVTSNGLLRFAPLLIEGLFEALRQNHALKVATGNLCRFDNTGGGFKMIEWNKRP
jgi:probable phosphoglycerate mutase